MHFTKKIILSSTSIVLLSSSLIIGMEQEHKKIKLDFKALNFNSNKQQKAKTDFEMGNLNILPNEIKNEILDYIFKNLDPEKERLENLIQIMNLKKVNKGFNAFITDKYGEKLKKIYDILGFEIINAIDKKDKDLATRLINCSANVNIYQKNRRTPLIYACLREYKDIVELLLKNGAAKTIDIQVKMSKQTALMASTKNKEIVELLIKYGADINKQNKLNGNTALMIASQRGEFETAKLLIDSGANINLRNKEGKTAFLLTLDQKIINMLEHEMYTKK